MAVRNPVIRASRGFKARYQSKKMRRPIGCESLLEFDAVHHFEFCTKTLSFEEQPEMIEFWVDGVRQVYFPDFELIMESGQVVHIEVKPKEKLKDPVLRERLKNIEEYYRKRGILFIVLTDQYIRNKVVLDNLKQLAYHNRWERDDHELQRAAETLSLLPPQTIDGAKAVLGNQTDVYRLLAAGVYTCDFHQPINGSTEIYKANKENGYVALFA
jgi:hypothetical protein